MNGSRGRHADQERTLQELDLTYGFTIRTDDAEMRFSGEGSSASKGQLFLAQASDATWLRGNAACRRQKRR